VRNKEKEMESLKLGILLSGGGRTLENIVEEIEADRLNARPVVVISSSAEAYGLTRAKNHGIPAHVVRLKDHPGIESFSDSITEILLEAGAELVLLAGFLKLYLVPEVYEGRVMNIHPALIPKFCGLGFYGHHVHEAVLNANEKESGCTVHFCDNEYDHGPIILQRRVPVFEDDTPDTLAARVFEEECKAYPEAIRMFIEGKIGPGSKKPF
jgi:formyltetrahydrofolate-dependent phosphoribosylglycinamide formyltransferase